jgi:cytochrome b
MTATTSSRNDLAASVRVWDLPTRVFHWSLVLCLISAWVSYRYSEELGDYTMRWHRWNGYAILVLLVFRVIWGITGSSTSRWSAFVRWPWTVARYALDLVRGHDRHFLGHNPLGTYMVLALLAAVAIQSTLGLFIVEHNDSGAYGPLYVLVSEVTYKKLSRWHSWVFYWMIIPLIGLHIAANMAYGLIKKDPLIRAMVTGKKPAANYEDATEAVIARDVILRALRVLVASAALVFGGILLLGGKLT